METLLIAKPLTIARISGRTGFPVQFWGENMESKFAACSIIAILMLGVLFSGCTSEDKAQEIQNGDEQGGQNETAENPDGADAAESQQSENNSLNLLFYDDFNDGTMNPAWKTADCDNADGTKFEEKEGAMQVYGGGKDIYEPQAGIASYPMITTFVGSDEYSAVYTKIDGNFFAIVKVTGADAIHEYSKTGIMIRNDISASGSSTGYVVLALESPDGGRGAYFGWDSDDNGYIDSSEKLGNTAYPMWLGISKNGTKFTGFFSMGNGKWEQIAQIEIASAQQSQDVGLFYAPHSYDDSMYVYWIPGNEMGTAKFDNFVVEKL